MSIEMRKDQCVDLYNHKCTGCAACANVCPKHAIQMEIDSEGFYVPVIDVEACICCKICIKICQANSRCVYDNKAPLKVVDAYAKNERIMNLGSSGGVFPILAQAIMNKGGVVFGAFFDPATKEVRHGSTEEVGLNSLCKSKYVQSNIGQAFTEVKELLEAGKTVLFAGTPCQVVGLNRFLVKQYHNLFTIDFICHGVPSPGVFQTRLKYHERKYRSRLLNCTFRDKDLGWRQQIIKLFFESGQSKHIRSRYSVYYNLFMQNYILRNSCYSCDLYKHHLSDLTLADAWESHLCESGVSRVFINTDKGNELFGSNLDEFHIQAFAASETNMESYKHRYGQQNRCFFFRYYKAGESNLMLFEICRIRCLIHRMTGKLFTKRKTNDE